MLKLKNHEDVPINVWTNLSISFVKQKLHFFFPEKSFSFPFYHMIQLWNLRSKTRTGAKVSGEENQCPPTGKFWFPSAACKEAPAVRPQGQRSIDHSLYVNLRVSLRPYMPWGEAVYVNYRLAMRKIFPLLLCWFSRGAAACAYAIIYWNHTIFSKYSEDLEADW